jgi:serine protease AprX
MTERIPRYNLRSMDLPGGVRLYLKDKLQSEENEPEPEHDSNDSMNSLISSDFLNSNGQVPLIISTKNKGHINNLIEKFSDFFSPEEASIVTHLPIVDGFEVIVKPDNFEKLIKTLPPESTVMVDSKLEFPETKPVVVETNKDILDRPEVNPADSTLNLAKLWEMGYTGKGVGLAVIDSGIHPLQDFDDRIVKFVDMTKGKEEPYDPYGHGTYVTGIAAGSGAASSGLYRGVAPGADIISLRITTVAEAIKAIQWATENKDEYNIRVMNLSLGDYPIESYKDCPWSQAAEKAWDAGIVVVAAAGNEGPERGSINTPGINPKIITVGYMDDKNTPDFSDDTIPEGTSRGPTIPDGLQKPDVVAPGVGIHGPIPPNSKMEELNRLAGIDIPNYDTSSPESNLSTKYSVSTGSSASTPLVAGLAAVLFEANPNLSPDDIKDIIKSTAIDYIPGATPEQQGSGVISPVDSLQTALAKKGPGQKEEGLTPFEVPMHLSENVIDRKKLNRG